MTNSSSGNRESGGLVSRVARLNEDQTITLPDGRTLGFAEYGDPQGLPVVFFHGTPGSRIGGRLADAWAREAGCRLIATDRPGYGLSTFQKGRKLVDHAADVKALCDELGAEWFAVLGASGGAPYVFACAATMPERVTAGAIVSGFYGMDAPVDPAELPEPVREQFEQIRADPEASRPNFDGTKAMLGNIEPEQFMQLSVAASPDWVQKLVTEDSSYGEAFVQHHIEGLRNGSDGGVQEMALNTRPWDIDLSSISTEIRLWHGGKDPVPRSHIDAVAAVLPNVSVSWHDDCGHLDCVFLLLQVFEWLAAVGDRTV